MLASGLGSRTTSGDKGLGNILPALYASASQADRPGLVDVTTGNNGLFTASSGYDQVSGLGTPLWSSLLPVLLAASPVAPATGVVSPVLRPVRSVDPGLTVGYTRSLAAPVAVTVPAGANYTGFAVGQDLPGCARLRSTPPTSAQLPADVEQGPVQLSLNALDSAKVCHQVTADIVYDSVAPTVMVTAESVDAQSTQVRLRLRGVDATSGVAAFDVRVRDAVGKLVYYAVSPSATRVLAHLKPGGRYTVQVVARDRAGNVGATTSTVVNVALDDGAFSRSGTWSRLNGTRDYQSSHLQTQQKGAAVTLTAVGKRIDGYLLKGPGQGYADLYVDGRFKARLILYAATTASYRPVLGSWPTAAGRHTVRLVATGLRRPGAVGSYLSVDGVLVVR